MYAVPRFVSPVITRHQMYDFKGNTVSRVKCETSSIFVCIGEADTIVIHVPFIIPYIPEHIYT